MATAGEGDGGDGLEALGSELRTGAGREFRLEAEEVERQADLGRRRRRTLADVAREAADRGLTLQVRGRGFDLRGRVLHVATDLVTLAVGETQVHVRLAEVSVGSASDERVDPPTDPNRLGSFTAALHEAAIDGVEVSVHAVGWDAPVEGRIEVVATGHVDLRDREGLVWSIATGAIRTVTRRGSSSA